MHQPYQHKLGHPPDFRVRYSFNLESPEKRTHVPKQGYRSDFWYDHKDQQDPAKIYMIWPEFEAEDGSVITDLSENILPVGTAGMWIIAPPMRLFHRDKIIVGLKGYFMEGLTRVAECEVIELVGLLTNPTT